MKNAILYYYKLNPDNISYINNNYYFKINDINYEFYNCDNYMDSINYIYEISSKLNNYKFPSHEIIKNISGNIVTNINNKNYTLMRIYVYNNDLITLNDILEFNNYVDSFSSIFKSEVKWDNLWESKIDYYEYEISQVGKKYPLLRDSFSYFDGLAENANILFKTVKNKAEFKYISHRRIKVKDTVKELYNPFNLIIDTKVRNVCEFFKERFFYNENILDEIKYFLSTSNYNNTEYILFFTRMMFPSFYFDLFQDSVINRKEDVILNSIIININKYEDMLSKLYMYMRNLSVIDEIEWLIKKI